MRRNGLSEVAPKRGAGASALLAQTLQILAKNLGLALLALAMVEFQHPRWRSLPR